MKQLLLLFLLMYNSLLTFAATKTWMGTSGGNWSTTGNWSGGTPTSLDDVIINGFNGNIVIDGNVTVNSLSITGNAAVTFTSTAARSITLSAGVGAPSSIIDTGSTLTIGSSSTINLIVQNGSGGTIFNINGNLIFVGTASSRLDCQGGVTTVNSTLRYSGGGNTAAASPATLTLAAGGVLDINKNGGSLPNATYNPNSLVLISGTTTNGPIWNSTPVYGNIQWNTPSQTSVAFINTNITCNNFTYTSSNGQQVRISTGTTSYILQVNGNFTSAAGTNLNIANGTASSFLKVKGNVIIDGNVTEEGTSTGSGIELNGTTAQTVAVAGAITNDVKVTLNNAAGATLLTNVTLSDSLVFTAGKLTLDTYNLTLSSSSPTVVSGHDAAKYVVTNNTGTLIRSIAAATNSYDFPVGTASDYRLANVVFTVAPTAGTLSSRFVAADPGSDGLPFTDNGANNEIATVSPTGYWSINGSVGGTYDMNLTTTGFADITAIEDARILKRTTGTTTWNNPATTGTHVAGSGTIATRSGFVGFSDFGIAQGLGPAPILLVSFTAKARGQINELNWQTAMELNADRFVIERSADGTTFAAIGEVRATGNSVQKVDYQYLDTKPLAGVNYYRLRQVDTDGTFVLTHIVKVDAKERGFMLENVYPNPATNRIVLKYQLADEMEAATLTVKDMTGRLWLTQAVRAEAGSHELPLEVSTFPIGTYLATITLDNGATVQQRFVKQ